MPIVRNSSVSSIVESVNMTSDKSKRLFKLRIEEEPHETFYKDEGGKANHLVAVVSVDGPSLQGKTISINPILCYENGKEVEDAPEIFKVVSIEPKLLKNANDTAIVKFRIEKVSRRKDGQRFKIRFDANDDSSTVAEGSVEHVSTIPICVLSKRKFSSSGPLSPPARRMSSSNGSEVKKLRGSSGSSKYLSTASKRTSIGLEENPQNALVLSLHKTIARLESKVSALTDRVSHLESELSDRDKKRLRRGDDLKEDYPIFNRVRGDSEETEFLYDFDGPFEAGESLMRSNSAAEICMNFGLPSSLN